MVQNSIGAISPDLLAVLTSGSRKQSTRSTDFQSFLSSMSERKGVNDSSKKASEIALINTTEESPMKNAAAKEKNDWTVELDANVLQYLLEVTGLSIQDFRALLNDAGLSGNAELGEVPISGLNGNFETEHIQNTGFIPQSEKRNMFAQNTIADNAPAFTNAFRSRMEMAKASGDGFRQFITNDRLSQKNGSVDSAVDNQISAGSNEIMNTGIQKKTSDGMNQLIHAVEQSKSLSDDVKNKILAVLQEAAQKMAVKHGRNTDYVGKMEISDTANVIMVNVSEPNAAESLDKPPPMQEQDGELELYAAADSEPVEMNFDKKSDMAAKEDYIQKIESEQLENGFKFSTIHSSSAKSGTETDKSADDSQTLFANDYEGNDTESKDPRMNHNQNQHISFHHMFKELKNNIPTNSNERFANGQVQESLRNSVLNQITEHASLIITDDKSEMVLQLYPENLGKLSLRVATEGEAMIAKLTTESMQVKQMIEANLSQLKEALANQGIHVQSFSVSVGDNGSQQQAYQRPNMPKYKKVGRLVRYNAMQASTEYLHDNSTADIYRFSDSQIDFIA